MSNTTLVLDYYEFSFYNKETLDFIQSENGYKFYNFKNGIWRDLYLSNGSFKMKTENTTEHHSNKLRHVYAIDDSTNLLITTFKEGIRMYISDINNSTITRIFNRKTALKFSKNENYISFGRYYHDISQMGAIMFSKTLKTIRFLQINKSYETPMYVFDEVSTTKKLLNTFCPNNWDYKIVQLSKTQKPMLVKSDDVGLCAFTFTKDGIIKFVLKILYSKNLDISRKDKIFFANLSGHRKWMDMIVFNSNGMFVFAYQKNSPLLYELINYNAMFSSVKGWTDKHTETVKFVDIDDDGFDDAVFTGPNGIEILSYNVYRNTWKSLLNTENLTPMQRHATILHAVAPVEGVTTNATLFTTHSDTLFVAQIVKKPVERMNISPINQKFSLQLNNNPIFPRKIIDISKEPRSTIYLRDYNIWFRKLASINPQTGKPYFILPLVNDVDPAIKFHLYYDASSSGTKPLGQGWSTTQNFIASSYEDSNFEEDEKYVLVVDNVPHQLQWLPANSSDVIKVFELEESTNNFDKTKFQVEFNRLASTWCVNYGTGETQYFGSLYHGTEYGAIITDIGWENWRGFGFDESGTVERANMWYLGISESNHVMTFYQYETLRNPMLARKFSYVAGVFLKKIHNINGEITFRYSAHQENDTDNLPFHLSNFTYNTPSTAQTIHFEHTAIGDTLLLTAIKQDFDYIAEPVLQFKYCEPLEGRHVMEKIILPTGTEISFTYDILGEPVDISEDNSKTVTVSDDYNVSYGRGFTLVSYIDKNLKQVILRMFTNDRFEEIYVSLKNTDSTKTVWPPLGQNAIAHEILLGESFLAVVVYNSQKKFVFLFGRREDGTWLAPPLPHEYSDEATVLKGNNFIIVSDLHISKVIVIEWFQSDCTWHTTSPMSIGYGAIAACGNKFVIYDDKMIFLGYNDRTKSRGWTLKKLVNIPGYLSGTGDILSKFNLKNDFNQALLGFFTKNSLHIKQNLVVLTKLVIQNGTQFATKIKTYNIGRDYQIVGRQKTVVAQDMFSKLESEIEMNSNGDSFTLKYSYENGNFTIILGSLQSLSGEPINQFNERIIKEMNLPAQRFLLDFKKYYVHLLGQTIECRNVKFTFGGLNWHRSEIERNSNFKDSLSVVLGDRFTVNKTDVDSTVKLYDASNQEELFDFQVKDVSKVKIHYPIYIVSQPKPGQINMIEFIDDRKPKFRHTKLPENKELSPFGNAFSLVTHETSPQGHKTLYIWPMYSLRRFHHNFVVSSMKTFIPGESGGTKHRITAYEYEEVSDKLTTNDISYDWLRVSPGNNRTSFGYFTITATTVKYFNGDNELIKTTEKEKHENSKQSDDNEENKKETTLYSTIGHFEIASFAPFSITSGMSDFIGFEDYEPSYKNWVFEKKNIVKDRFALTGENYLHLNSTFIRREFSPDFQDRQFVVSCWIRTPSVALMPNTGDIVPFLKTSILMPEGKEVMILLADVKYQIRDWSYLEVVLDLNFTNLLLKASNQTVSNNLHVEVCVSATKKGPIDVDHIRFSPLNNIFEVNVYDRQTRKPLTVIKSNGAITRQVYDKYQVQIAEINESNQIPEFITYTKGLYTNGPFKHPPCTIKITSSWGFYSDFSDYEFRSQWSLTNGDRFATAPGTLRHYSARRSHLTLNSALGIDIKSFATRFLYSLTNMSSILIFDVIEIQCDKDKAEISLSGIDFVKQTIPIEGEIVLVMKQHAIIVWVDGILYIDHYRPYLKSFNYVVHGEIKIQHMMLFNQPHIEVSYKNTLGQEIQQISLISATTAIVKEMLYDELGRQTITVQPVEIARSTDQPLIAYTANLVLNDDPSAPDSVWQTGKLIGEINKYVANEYAFSQIVYDNNPLNIRTRIGLPGKDFSVNGLYARRFNHSMTNSFLHTKYPRNKNFTFDVQYDFDGNEKITVFDGEENKVASYFHVKNGKDLFSTFEYNKRGLMIKCRPPTFYNKFGKNTTDLPESHPLITRIEYDAKGNPTHKFTPDMGPVVNVYDEKDQLRFVIQYSRDQPKVVDSITYFVYDAVGRLTSTGEIEYLVEKTRLLQLQITNHNGREFQRFYYSDNEPDPAFRGRISRCITMNQNEPLHEESIYDFGDNLISKRIILSTGNDKPSILSINKRFDNGLLKEIIYPASMFGEIFRVTYEYDKLGRMTSVGAPQFKEKFITINYNANNQISSEYILRLDFHGFRRKYSYNDPGYLTKIEDPFLLEEISYNERAYGNQSHGDGRVGRVKFFAKWHNMSSGNGIGLREDSFQNDVISFAESQRCFRELKREKYLNIKNQQTRVFYPNLKLKLSFACTEGTMESRVKQILGKYGFPEEYGFLFNYGPYGELKTGKYFVGNTSQEPQPFQSNMFTTIPGIDEKHSMDIWNLLKLDKYIDEAIDSDDKDIAKPFIRKSLDDDLKSVNSQFQKYAKLIRKILLKKYSTRQYLIPPSVMKKIFYEEFPHKTAYAKTILEILSKKDYLKNPIDPNFMKTLRHFNKYSHEILDVIQTYKGMDRSEFDMESKEIDSNGNRVKFNIGYENYHLRYELDSNRVREVIRSIHNGTPTKYLVLHDDRGNVIKAMHKGIELIEYHSVSNRVQKVLMQNGNVITFDYDSKGERVLKRVTDKNGLIKSEMQYLRDETGRSVVERKLTYVAKNQTPDRLVTLYIYGPKYLIGFVRRDQFYSVFTDHQGSVRLVIRDGEVVAAYDYMPYGRLMRIFGNSPDVHISYRYTGQEFDVELDLYNYHARLYDPSIGRFYQIDAMSQHFSPYQYVGNSPVSMVDPSGSIGILLVLAVIGFMILGAYIAGTAANNDHDITKWDWSKRSTYLAIFVGGVTGALIPLGIKGSFVALTVYVSKAAAGSIITSVGLSTTYLSAAATNEDWNPGNWDYTSYDTWWAAFEGFSMGVGIISGYYGAWSKFITYSRRGKYIFGGAVTLFGGTSAILAGVSTEWDYKKPKFWFSIFSASASAPDLPMFGASSFDFIQKYGKKIYRHRSELRKFGNVFRRNQGSTRITDEMSFALRDTTKNVGKLLLAFFGVAFVLNTLVTLHFDELEHVDLTKISTYHNIVNSAHLTTNAIDTTQTTVEITREEGMLPPRIRTFVAKKTTSFAESISQLRAQLSFFFRSVENVGSIRLKTSPLAVLARSSAIDLISTSNRFVSPFFYARDPLKINSPMTLIYSTSFSKSLENTILATQNQLEEMLKNQLMNENVSEWKVGNTTLGELDNPKIMRRCEKTLKELLQSESAYISSDLVRNTLREMNFDDKHSQAARQNYIKKSNKLRTYKDRTAKRNLNYWQRKKTMLIIKNREIYIKNLKSKELGAVDLLIQKLYNILWNKLESYENLMAQWEISNFEEPPIAMLSKLSKTSLPKYLPNPSLYESSEDLMFLSSYELQSMPQMTGFQNCYTCIQATSKTRTTVRDLTWLALLNQKFISENGTIDASENDNIKLTKKKKRRSIEATNNPIESALNFKLIQEIKQNQNVEQVGNVFGQTKNIFERPKITKDKNGTKQNAFHNSTKFGDRFLSKFASNETIFLAQVIFAKCKNLKLFKQPKIANNMVFMQNERLACEMIELLEEALETSAKASVIDIDLLDKNNDYELYEKLISLITKKEYENIFHIMMEYALKALPERKIPHKNKLFRKSLEQFDLNSKIENILIKTLLN